MSEGPNLTLPQRERWAPQPSRRGPLVALGAALIALLALQVYQVARPAPAAPAAEPAASSRRPRAPVDLKEVALNLQRNNLHAAAAEAYEEYLASAEASPEEWANLQLQIGRLLARAGKYEEALGHLLRAKPAIPPANDDALQKEVLACLGRLGKHSEQGYELADRMAPPGAAGKPAGNEAAGQVVAWIGPEKITSSELDDEIAREVEERAAAVPGLPPERVAEMKTEAQKRFAAPQARLAKLREIVAKRLLYREGQERDLERSTRVQKRVADFSREVVIEEVVLSTMRDRIKITDRDVALFHRANAARYREPPSARVRLAVLADEAKARELLAAAKTEDDFARLAREGSLEKGSRENGGLLEEPVTEGKPIPGLGAAPELTRAIFSAEAGRAAGPVKAGAGWAVAWVRERKPERMPALEEVRERVARDYLEEKEAEVQSGLVQELFKKYAASIATDTFLPPAEGVGKAAPSTQTTPGPGAAGVPAPVPGSGTGTGTGAGAEQRTGKP